MFRQKENKGTLTDEELLQVYKDTHDSAYLGELYNRYMPLVYGCCLKYLKNSENAQDAVMHLFEDLLKKTLAHPILNFKPWLYTLTKNYCLMQLRSSSKTKTVNFDDTFMEFKDDFHLDSILEDEQKLSSLEDCIQHLPADQRKGIVYFFMKERSYKEICETTRWDMNQVKSYIQNGKRNLKLCLERKGILRN